MFNPGDPHRDEAKRLDLIADAYMKGAAGVMAEVKLGIGINLKLATEFADIKTKMAELHRRSAAILRQIGNEYDRAITSMVKDMDEESCATCGCESVGCNHCVEE